MSCCCSVLCVAAWPYALWCWLTYIAVRVCTCTIELQRANLIHTIHSTLCHSTAPCCNFPRHPRGTIAIHSTNTSQPRDSSIRRSISQRALAEAPISIGVDYCAGRLSLDFDPELDASEFDRRKASTYTDPRPATQSVLHTHGPVIGL